MFIEAFVLQDWRSVRFDRFRHQSKSSSINVWAKYLNQPENSASSAFSSAGGDSAILMTRFGSNVSKETTEFACALDFPSVNLLLRRERATKKT
jgi:hypothetical protein